MNKYMDILQKGSETWNNWRKKYPKVIPDFSNEHLTNLHLDDYNLRKVLFKFSTLSDITFLRSDLEECNFYNAWIRDVKFSSANISLGQFENANLAGVDFETSIAVRVNFKGSVLEKPDFQNSDLRNANFSMAKIDEGIFFKSILTGADLKNSTITNTKFIKANLSNARLQKGLYKNSSFDESKLTRANLSSASLHKTSFQNADLSNAKIRKTDLSFSLLTYAKLIGTDFSDTSLEFSNLVGANIENAIFSKTKVYGASIWNIEGEPKLQNDLIISPSKASHITTQNLEVAHLIYWVLDNKKIGRLIDSFTNKLVLILGRFYPEERKEILSGIKELLMDKGFVPVVFDFDRPTDRDITETIKILAGLSMFVIADVTNPKSSPLELQATVPDYQIPFIPIIQKGEEPFSMMKDLQTKYDWFLPTLKYNNLSDLAKTIDKKIIKKAIDKKIRLQNKKSEKLKSVLT